MLGQAPVWLPAVPIRVVNALAEAGMNLDRTTEPRAGPDCLAEDSATERRLLVGPKLTGKSANPLARDARAVSAAMLLDPEVDRDDRRLFTGRIVLIGATHSGSGDFWLTPGGVLPGVELLANTIHYAPLDADDGLGSELAFRALTVLLFGIFVVLDVVAARHRRVLCRGLRGAAHRRDRDRWLELFPRVWIAAIGYLAVGAVLRRTGIARLDRGADLAVEELSPGRYHLRRALRAACVQEDE